MLFALSAVQQAILEVLSSATTLLVLRTTISLLIASITQMHTLQQ